MSDHYGDEYIWISEESEGAYRIAYNTGKGFLQVKEVHLLSASNVISTVLEDSSGSKDLVREVLFPSASSWMDSLPLNGTIIVTPYDEQVPDEATLTAMNTCIKSMPEGLIKTHFQQGLNEVNKILHLRLASTWRPKQLTMVWIPQS